MKHILFLSVLLCGLFGPTLVEGAKGQGMLQQQGHEGTTISTQDTLLRAFSESRQRLNSLVFQSSQTPQRVGSSRTVRIMPTHGSPPSRGMGRFTENTLSNLLKYACLYLQRSTTTLRSGTASPRFYYVIALRRILC